MIDDGLAVGPPALNAAAEVRADPPAEQWRPTRWPGYEVSNLGRVRHRARDGRLITACGNLACAPKPILYVDGPTGQAALARLVLEAFGTPPAGPWHPEYLDGDRLDCRASNLRAVPVREPGRQVGKQGPTAVRSRSAQDAAAATAVAAALERFAIGADERPDRCPRCGGLVQHEPAFVRCVFGCGRLWPIRDAPVALQREYEYASGLRRERRSGVSLGLNLVAYPV